MSIPTAERAFITGIHEINAAARGHGLTRDTFTDPGAPVGAWVKYRVVKPQDRESRVFVFKITAPHDAVHRSIRAAAYAAAAHANAIHPLKVRPGLDVETTQDGTGNNVHVLRVVFVPGTP